MTRYLSRTAGNLSKYDCSYMRNRVLGEELGEMRGRRQGVTAESGNAPCYCCDDAVGFLTLEVVAFWVRLGV